MRLPDGRGGASAVAQSTVVSAWPEAVPDSLLPPPRARRTVPVVIEDGHFLPAVLMVSAGTDVEFRNQDRVFHVPFSVSPAGAFELGRCAPGSAHATAFDRPGVVEVYCALHPQESMYVVVSPQRWHAHPSPDGSFAFRNLPFGTYLVHAFRPGQGEATRRVEVTGRRPVAVSF